MRSISPLLLGVIVVISLPSVRRTAGAAQHSAGGIAGDSAQAHRQLIQERESLHTEFRELAQGVGARRLSRAMSRRGKEVFVKQVGHVATAGFARPMERFAANNSIPSPAPVSQLAQSGAQDRSLDDGQTTAEGGFFTGVWDGLTYPLRFFGLLPFASPGPKNMDAYMPGKMVGIGLLVVFVGGLGAGAKAGASSSK